VSRRPLKVRPGRDSALVKIDGQIWLGERSVRLLLRAIFPQPYHDREAIFPTERNDIGPQWQMSNASPDLPFIQITP
jgi:hypothetical protein